MYFIQSYLTTIIIIVAFHRKPFTALQLNGVESVVSECKADTLVRHVKLRVVDSDEDIAQDPSGPARDVEVDAQEPTQTDFGASAGNLTLE